MQFPYLTVIAACSVLAVFISGLGEVHLPPRVQKFFAAIPGSRIAALALCGLPIVVCEIFLGIGTGSTGAGLLPPTDHDTAVQLAGYSEMGLSFLMFLCGCHLMLHDPNLRKAALKSSLALVTCFVLAAPLSFFVLPQITGFNQPLFFELLLANCSSAVVMPSVNGMKLSGPVVLMTTAWIAFADAITIFAVPMALAPERLTNALMGAGIVLALAVVFLVSLLLFRKSKYGERMRQRSKDYGHALDFRQMFLILVALDSVATYFGISMLLAGFAAGAIVAIIGQPRRFAKQSIGAAEGVFCPIFFVMLGAQLNFAALVENPKNLILAFSIAIAGTIVRVVAVKMPYVKMPIASGLTGCATLGLPAALASLGLQNHLIDSGQAAAIIASSLLTIMISVVGVNMLKKYSVAAPAGAGHPDEQTDAPGHDE